MEAALQVVDLVLVDCTRFHHMCIQKVHRQGQLTSLDPSSTLEGLLYLIKARLRTLHQTSMAGPANEEEITGATYRVQSVPTGLNSRA